MLKLLALLASHAVALALGFALGVCALPLLRAPAAPTLAQVESYSQFFKAAQYG